MAKTPAVTIQFSQDTHAHIARIDRKYHKLITDTIAEQLSHDPTDQTRNRKQLRLPAPFGATWELRIGPQIQFRVFYDVDMEAMVVIVLAIARRIVAGGKDVSE